MCHNIPKECPGLQSLTTGSTGPWHSASGPEVVTCTLRVLNPRLAASPMTLFLRESNSFVSHVARKCLEKKRTGHSRCPLRNTALASVQ